MYVRGRIVILLVIVSGLFWKTPTFTLIRAQDEIALERLFVSTNSNFAFFYPANWKVQRNGTAILMGDAKDMQTSASKQAPKSLMLQIQDGDRAAFKLGPSDDLESLMAMMRPKDSSGSAAQVQPIQL